MGNVEFPSKEWSEIFCKKINENNNYKNAAKGWKWPLMFKVIKLPEDLQKKYPSGTIGIKADLFEGQCRGIEFYDDASKGNADFVLTAEYNDWMKILTGELNPVTAILQGKLKLEKGSMATVMRFPSAAVELVKSAQEASK
ncbi:SCP2 sterol-binding domain-containing protein [Caldisphaera lagunensis]|uniref:SCP2 sterol-binding domain-containing protein n=1 Tax=Caldisphaera lagunensis TaxID=200415 RepID=UPI0006629F6B|nr:SCP2 sterol-binding domain-containing protein [Caldisphaera lagunensis]